MELPLRIYAKDEGLVKELFGENIDYSREISISENAKIKLRGLESLSDSGFCEIINTVLEVGNKISVESITNWIFEKMRGKIEKIIIGKTEIIF